MKIQPTNNIIFDPSGFFKIKQLNSKVLDYREKSYYLMQIENQQIKLRINLFRFNKAFIKNDYWMSFRFLNLIRENIMSIFRIKMNKPSKLFFLTDEDFENDTNNSFFRESFIIDGELNSLKKTKEILLNYYYSITNKNDLN